MIVLVELYMRWAPPCLFVPQYRETDLLDLQHANSSTSPEIHESKWAGELGEE